MPRFENFWEMEILPEFYGKEFDRNYEDPEIGYMDYEFEEE